MFAGLCNLNDIFFLLKFEYKDQNKTHDIVIFVFENSLILRKFTGAMVPSSLSEAPPTA